MAAARSVRGATMFFHTGVHNHAKLNRPLKESDHNKQFQLLGLRYRSTKRDDAAKSACRNQETEWVRYKVASEACVRVHNVHYQSNDLTTRE